MVLRRVVKVQWLLGRIPIFQLIKQTILLLNSSRWKALFGIGFCSINDFTPERIIQVFGYRLSSGCCSEDIALRQHLSWIP